MSQSVIFRVRSFADWPAAERISGLAVGEMTEMTVSKGGGISRLFSLIFFSRAGMTKRERDIEKTPPPPKPSFPSFEGFGSDAARGGLGACCFWAKPTAGHAVRRAMRTREIYRPRTRGIYPSEILGYMAGLGLRIDLHRFASFVMNHQRSGADPHGYEIHATFGLPDTVISTDKSVKWGPK